MVAMEGGKPHLNLSKDALFAAYTPVIEDE